MRIFSAHTLSTEDILLRISFYLSLRYKQNKQPIDKRHPRELFEKLIKKQTLKSNTLSYYIHNI